MAGSFMPSPSTPDWAMAPPTSRTRPLAAIDRPAAVACTAPQAPSARPVSSGPARFIGAVSVPWANRPPPSPIRLTPAANRSAEASGAAKTTAEKARMPMPTPTAETRNGAPAAPEPGGGDEQAEPAAGGEQCGQRGCRPDREVQDLAAIG